MHYKMLLTTGIIAVTRLALVPSQINKYRFIVNEISFYKNVFD